MSSSKQPRRLPHKNGGTGSAESRVKIRKKRTKRLYDQYLADSGSDNSSVVSAGEDVTVDCEEYSVEMDINVLIQQTVQNMIQSVCLEDYDGLSRFGDHELTCFAAAVKHNSSIVSLQIRYLDVSDISLVPLCRALQSHPSLRAVDLSGTRGGDATSKALCKLVCYNPSIIFLRADDTVVNGKDTDLIYKATQYNAMVCADPNNNPFQLGLLRKISAMEEEEQKFQEQLHAKPWLRATESGDVGHSHGNEVPQKNSGKKVTITSSGTSKIVAEICAQFIQGQCRYGSRCKFFHPERTSALKNAAAVSQFDKCEKLSGSMDTRSSVWSSVSGMSRQRLQSRLRPSHFTLTTTPGRAQDISQTPGIESDAPESSLQLGSSLVVAPLWALSLSVVVCCAVLNSYL